MRHYSRRTEQAYVDWVRRYILFHQKKHPSTMGASEVVAFLSWLAVDRQVSASTQNQALSGILSPYKAVLGLDIGPIEHVPRARMPDKLPVPARIGGAARRDRGGSPGRTDEARELSQRGRPTPKLQPTARATNDNRRAKMRGTSRLEGGDRYG